MLSPEVFDQDDEGLVVVLVEEPTEDLHEEVLRAVACARRARCTCSTDGPRPTGYSFRVNEQVRSSSSNRIPVRAPSGDRVRRSEKRVLSYFRSREGGEAPFPPRYRYHWPLPLSRRSSCGPSPDGNSANAKRPFLATSRVAPQSPLQWPITAEDETGARRFSWPAHPVTDPRWAGSQDDSAGSNPGVAQESWCSG
ncbi:ferredoxin [Streptomyces antimycoticus]